MGGLSPLPVFKALNLGKVRTLQSSTRIPLAASLTTKVGWSGSNLGHALGDILKGGKIQPLEDSSHR